MLGAPQVYFASGIVRWLCQRAFWPLLFARLVTEVELSPFQLVVLGTVFEAGIFLGEIPTGVVADLYSRRLSVIISFVLGGLAFVMSGLATEFWVLVISQILVGLAVTFYSGAETAWVTDEVGSPAEVEALILRRSQWQFLAAVVGVAGFSGLAALTSLSTAIVVIGVATFVWGLVLIVIMSEHNFSRTEGDGWNEFLDMVRSGLRVVSSQAPLRILALVIVIGGLAKEAIDRLDIQRLDDIGFPDDIDVALIVGVLVAIRLILAAGVLAVARRRVAGDQVVPALATLLGCVAIGIAVLAHADLLWLAAAGMVFQGGFHGAMEPIVTIWANTFAPSESRATVHSFIGQAESFGEVIGGLSLGAVAELFSVPTAMTISAILFGVAALLTMTAQPLWDGDG